MAPSRPGAAPPAWTAPWCKRPGSRAAGEREATALRLLGDSVVGLVSWDGRTLCTERVVPGADVSSLSEEDATQALAEALLRLWVPVPAGCALPGIAQECRQLSDPVATAPLPAGLVGLARDTLDRLLTTAPEAVVLHGDLHHGNLLRGPSGWVAIDPHGVIGDPAYDVGPMLINPFARISAAADLAWLTARRLDLLADALGLARERLAAWGLVRAVLSEAWSVQDTGRPDGRPSLVARVLAGSLG